LGLSAGLTALRASSGKVGAKSPPGLRLEPKEAP
jgi:hypothetical protein